MIKKISDGRVVVTGGYGFVGKALQKVKPNWIYHKRGDCDLSNYYDCLAYFKFHKPDSIIHLAARVGGIQDNINNPADFFDENITMNTNVVRTAHRCGVNRILASLSTCVFPAKICGTYPFDESQLLEGAPPETNTAYAFAKRALYIQLKTYREQYGRDYSCFTPSNIYGPGDKFDERNSHFIANLIKLVASNNGEEIEFMGTGSAIRQQLYVDDLAKIIPMLLELHHSDSPVIVAPDESYSVAETISLMKDVTNKQFPVTFNGLMNGQVRKDGNNALLKSIIGDFEFTALSVGLKKAYDWYIEHGE